MNRNFNRAAGREHARSEPEYASVKGTLAQRTDLAILISRDDLNAPVWVPKRALAIHSRAPVEKAPLKSEIEIRVELSFALKNKLV